MIPLATSEPAKGPAQTATDDAIGDGEFAPLIDALGPFERAPHVAAGVSGGADSMALALLADRWARERGGKVTALIVDHGLRADSAAEAEAVGHWLAARDIAHTVLRWEGPKPGSAIQHAARNARYRLLTAWCREAGVLHLLLAHQRDDQLETMLLRRERKSGPDGLAAMAAVAERAELRILRPLLGMPSARLRATLRQRRQAWVEDPSNLNPAFARVRMRAVLAGGAPADADRLAGEVHHFGRERLRAEAEVARLLARSVAVYPAGWATIDPAPWRAGDPAIARRALVRVVLTVGGGDYAPRGDRLDRLLDAILGGALGGGRTLAGCRILPDRGGILVMREAAKAQERIVIDHPGRFVWDGRFEVTVAGRSVSGAGGYVLARLGEEGWRQVAEAAPETRAIPMPPAVRPTLPTLVDLEGVLAVPHLMYGRRGSDPDSVTVVSAMFRPRHALAGPGFAVI